jgi:hypothetical protein
LEAPNVRFITIILVTLSALCSLIHRVVAQPVAQNSPDQKQVNNLSQQEILRLLASEKPSEVRRAADSLRGSPPKQREELVAAAEGVKYALGIAKDPDAEIALRLALGTLGAAGIDDAAEWGFESMSVTHGPKTPGKVFKSHVQALEMVPGAAKELMIENLDVALNMPAVEPQERRRLKEFVTLTAEGMRTRELAVFLNALLTGQEDLFVKIEAPLEARLIACYQNVKVDPPINADAVLQWLDKHPGSPVEVELAALETVSLVGTTKSERLAALAERLLAKPETTAAIAKRLLSGNIDRKLSPKVRDALARHAANDTTGELAKILKQLDDQR